MVESDRMSALVLAAGKGTRMKSARAKVLHELFFAPMIHHVLAALEELPLAEVFVVVGHQAGKVRSAVAGFGVTTVEQPEQLGTGHAVICARGRLADAGGRVLILCGDLPLIRPETLRNLQDEHLLRKPALTVMTTALEEPTGYGRVLCDDGGRCLRIVEERDATAAERATRVVNTGVYCASVSFLLAALDRLDSDNDQGEFYLTDIVEIAHALGERVDTFQAPDPLEVLGVNSREELALAHKGLQQRRNRELMDSGVTILDPDTVTVAPGVRIGRDTVLHPAVYISGTTRIGADCTIGPAAVVQDCVVEDGVVITPHSYLNSCQVNPPADS